MSKQKRFHKMFRKLNVPVVVDHADFMFRVIVND